MGIGRVAMRIEQAAIAGLLLVLLLVSRSSASELAGKVVGVVDGDTIDVLVDRRPVRIRLAEIDTPERGQPWGSRAKQGLSELVFGKDVRAVVVDTDFYGRLVGRVYVEGLYVNAELLRAGHAWVYRKYSRDPSLLVLERQAKEAKRGLWRLPEAERTPPWEWRAASRSGSLPRAARRNRDEAEEPDRREENVEPPPVIPKWQTPSGALYFGDRPPTGSRKVGEYRPE